VGIPEISYLANVFAWLQGCIKVSIAQFWAHSLSGYNTCYTEYTSTSVTLIWNAALKFHRISCLTALISDLSEVGTVHMVMGLIMNVVTNYIHTPYFLMYVINPYLCIYMCVYTCVRKYADLGRIDR
jgi:hypothetical protein